MGGRHRKVTGIHRPEVFFPEQAAVGGVETKQALAAEDGDDARAVGGGGGVAVCGLGVADGFWHAFVAETVPEDFSGGPVEGEEAPLVGGVVFGRADVAVESDLQINRAGGADRGRDVDSVAGYDGRSVGQAGERGLPADVFAGRDVPRGRERGGGVEAAGVRPAILGPRGGGNGEGGGEEGGGEDERVSASGHGWTRRERRARRTDYSVARRS